jgi:hypothetical protein
MIPSPKLSFVTNDNIPTSVGLAPGSARHFGRLQFINNRFGHQSLSPKEWDSGAIFIGMVHSG